MSTQPHAVHRLEFTLGDHLRRARRSLRPTPSQAAFAHALGYNDKQYGAWESDTNRPNDVLELARRIEERYGISATWVLGLDEGPRHPDGDGGLRIVRARRDSNPQPSDPKVGPPIATLRQAA